MASAREKTSVDANVPTAAERRMVRVEATVDRRSWGILRGRFRADSLATPRSGAPRPPRGPGEPARAKGSSLPETIGHKVLPMLPAGLFCYLSSRLLTDEINPTKPAAAQRIRVLEWPQGTGYT